MSSAKAALESDTRVLSFEAGRKYGVRVNAISAGPLASRAASAIGIIEKMVEYCADNSPLPEPLRRRKLETQRRSSRARSLPELPAPCFTSTRDTTRWGWRFKRWHPKADSRLRIFFGGCRCSFPLDPDFDFLKTRH